MAYVAIILNAMAALCVALCCPCFQASVPIRLINGLYPTNVTGKEIGLKPDNVGRLTSFALRNPKLLPMIGRFLSDRILLDLRKKRNGFVVIGMQTFEKLIEATHTELDLYDKSVMDLILLLLPKTHSIEVRAATCATLAMYARLQANKEGLLAAQKLNKFIEPLLDLCVCIDDDIGIITTLRVAGLRTVVQLVLALDTPSLERHMKIIIPCVLSNMYSCIDDDEVNVTDSTLLHFHDNRDTIISLSKECLANLSSVTNAATMHILLKPVFQYLNAKHWEPTQFAADCIRYVSVTSHIESVPLFVHLLRYMKETIGDEAISQYACETPVEFLKMALSPRQTDAISAVNTTWMHECLDTFIDEYFMHVAKKDDYSTYRTVVLNSILSYGRSVASTFEFIDVLQYIVNSHTTVGQSPNTISRILDIVLTFAPEMPPLPSHMPYPPSLFADITRISTLPGCANSDMTILVTNCLACIIHPRKKRSSVGRQSTGPRSRGLSLMRSSLHKSRRNMSELDPISTDCHIIIESFIFACITDEKLINPEMAVSMFELCCSLLETSLQEEVLRLLSLFHKVQTYFTSIQTERPLKGDMSTHTLIAVVLLCISTIAESNTLEQYVFSILSKRHEAGYLSPSLKITKNDDGIFGLTRYHKGGVRIMNEVSFGDDDGDDRTASMDSAPVKHKRRDTGTSHAYYSCSEDDEEVSTETSNKLNLDFDFSLIVDFLASSRSFLSSFDDSSRLTGLFQSARNGGGQKSPMKTSPKKRVKAAYCDGEILTADILDVDISVGEGVSIINSPIDEVSGYGSPPVPTKFQSIVEYSSVKTREQLQEFNDIMCDLTT